MKPRYEEIRDRLRYVKRERDDYDLTNFPDFLAVGPQRTGTTWLFVNLLIHPQVFIPRQKEIYFWNNLEYPELHPESLPPVGQELGWYLQQFEVSAEVASERSEQCREMFDCAFEPIARGEASATYAASLHEGVISEILTLNPSIKIIMFVRNPIDRAWSHAKKDLVHQPKRRHEDVTEDEWLRFLRRPYIESCGRFSVFLDRWQSLVPADNLIVSSFADIAERPNELLIKILDEIGVSSALKFVSRRSKNRAQRTDDVPVPDNLRRFLEDMFGDEIAELQRRGLL